MEKHYEILIALLLEQEQTIDIHRCIAALSNDTPAVVFSSIVPTARVKEHYSKWAKIFQGKTHLIYGFERLIPALDVWEDTHIMLTNIVTQQNSFLLFSDVNYHSLIGMLVSPSSQRIFDQAKLHYGPLLV